MASLANTEIVFEGWLVKSPPTKRIWRAKWRRRWFVLKQTGELPGQYFLEYYTDRTCRKLKGKIDLDQCEQVDSGLTIESRKQRYAHMFDIRTPKRVYFLAADSEEDMNSWVGCICHVCGLKVFYREEEEEANAAALTLTRPVSTSSSTTSTTTTAANQQLARTLQTNHLALGEDTPPTSPVSPTGSSGPYFPLSECLSGSRSLFFSEVLASSNQPSSAPVTPAPTARGLGLGTQSLRGKPRREDWDLFYDQPRQLGHQTAAGQTTHSHQQILRENDDQDIHDTIRGLEEKFVRSFKKLLPTGGQKQASLGGGQKFVPPPRPPKPPHLSDQPSHNYLNLDQLHSGGGGRTHSRSSSPRSPPSISPPLPTPTNPDAWYDFPRSHQGDHHSVSAVNSPVEVKGEGHSRRHCYTNAAPGEMLKSASATSTTAEVFTFNSSHQNAAAATAISPSVYSNMASPFPLASPALLPMTPFSPPPSVNRTLKPKKAGSGSNEGAAPPPSVNRQLKPHRPVSGIGPHPELQGGSSSDDAEDPSSRGSSRPNSAEDDEQVYFFEQVNNNPLMAGGGRQTEEIQEIQYLDLDHLESDSSLQSPKSPERGVLMHHHHTLPHHHSHHSHHQASSTVYKTVDFIKTEAFNRTRLKVEVDRYKKAQ